MVPEILQIVQPTINWTALLSGASGSLDRSVSSELDRKQIPPSTYGAYLGALAEFEHEGSDPEAALRQRIKILHHLWFSFMVRADNKLEAEIRNSDLRVLVAGGKHDSLVVMLSGTMLEWITAIRQGLSEIYSRNYRILLSKFYLYFCSQGLVALFGKKSESDDGTLLLE